MNGRLIRRLVALVSAVGVVALVVVFAGGALLHTGISLAGRLAGYRVAYARLENRSGHLTIFSPDVGSLAGEPIFSASRIDLAYSLHDIFRAGYHYGISSVELSRPKVTLIHHPDGTWNVALPASNSATASAFTPPVLHLVVKDGSLGILDRTRIFAHSRAIALEDVQAVADLQGSGRSHFTFRLALLEEGGKFPVAGRGTLDEDRGYELSRITVRTLAIAPLLDYALNSTTLHFANGVLNDVDLRLYGLLDRDGAMQRHISGSANLDHFQPYLGSLAKPLRDGRGRLFLYDDGIAAPRIDGSIAGIPVRIAGGIYGLSHPTVRLGIVGRGQITRLLTLATAAKQLPLRGSLVFALFIEGAALQPTTLASFHSSRVYYRRVPLDDPNGLVALRGTDTTIVRSGLTYDGIAVGTRGRLTLARHTGVDLLATVAAPMRNLPYAPQLFGPMVVRGTAVASGSDANLLTSGVVSGSTPSQRLAGTFSVDASGEGTIGPLTLDGPGSRSLYARIALDRPHGAGGAAYVSVQRLRLATASVRETLPGFDLPALPPVDGTLDANVAGSFASRRYAVGGDAHLWAAHAFGVPIDDLRARVVASDPQNLALQGTYRGALAPLARALGGKVAAAGTAYVPFSLLARGSSQVIAQIRGARFTAARVGDLPLEELEGTVALRGHAFDVFGARARLAGNDVVANGSFGNGGSLLVSAAGIDLGRLRAAGFPVRSGSASALVTVSGSARAPDVRGGIAASDMTLSSPGSTGLKLDVSSDLDYDRGTLALRDALLQAGPAVATLDGTVSELRADTGLARLAFEAHVRQADVGTLAAVFHTPLQYPEGSLNADVAISGTAAAPRVRGDIALPEGSLNGLPFRDASVAFAASAAEVHARDGRVTVGSSVLGFAADASPSAQTISVRAPRVDLADFNDYFDDGDTLGGSGDIFVTARNAPDAFALAARAKLRHTRFRRFDIGDTNALVSTRKHTLAVSAAVAAAATGNVTADGAIVLPATQPLRNLISRSQIALGIRAQNVVLATWLPAAGLHLPLEGDLDTTATVRGTYPNIAVVAHADLQHGLAGRVPIRTASIDVKGTAGRVSITRASLALDDLAASASGFVDVRKDAPFDLTLGATTQNVGALAQTLTGKTYDASGTVKASLHLTGNALAPLADGVLEASAIRYERFTLPRAQAEIAVTRTRATLRRAEADFQSGRLLATGYLPLRAGSARFSGSAAAPLSLSLTADSLGLAQFADMLPQGTRMAGQVDGAVALGGSLAKPGLSGTLLLSNGSFSGPLETEPIVNAHAQLVFRNRTLTLGNTSATVGGGALSLDGSVSLASLQDPLPATSAALRIVADNATFDFPAYFKGRVLGSLTVTRSPGAPAVVGGNLALSSTRIPPTALLQNSTPNAQPALATLPAAFDLHLTAGSDVRVQGGPVDVGAQGSLDVGGTLAAPTLRGELTSTGGTISFYRTFQLQYPSRVSFSPSNGVIPYVNATATSYIDNPPTSVTLAVTGLATQLNVELQSDPAYSRAQILGLLVGAQALGAVSGVQTANGQQVNPFQAAANGELGTLLTQNLLEPFSAKLGSAVGLNALALNYSPGAGGGVSLSAQKRLFKNVNAVFAQSFNYPPRQTIGVVASPNDATAIQLSAFSQPASNPFDPFQATTALLSTNVSLTSAQPVSGTSGFALSFQKKFR